MRRLLFSFVLGMTVLTGAAARAALASEKADKSETHLEKERRQALAWMDGLELPDVKQLRFVRVQTGSAEDGAGRMVPVHRYGFLLASQGATFKVLDVDLGVGTFERTAPDVPSLQRIDFEPMELAEFLKTSDLQRLAADANQVQFGADSPASVSVAASAETRYLFLAWACAKTGLEDAAAGLLHKACNVRSETLRTNYHDNRFGGGPSEILLPSSPSEKDSPKLSLQERASMNLAAVETARAFVAFRDPKVSRAQLLAKFERILRLFPTCPQHALVCEMTVRLGMMIDEDRYRLAKKRPEQLGEREQLVELVYLLRDQTGTVDEMGTCNLFANPASPASKLVARGYAAVPVLLEHVGDRCLTRCPERFLATEPLLTVGDCAEKILAQISGIGFEPGEEAPHYSRHMLLMSVYAQTLSEGARASATMPRAVFGAWYACLKQKGEKRLLIEGVAHGDFDSLVLGRRLLDRYPEAALPPLITAAHTGRQQELRQQFVEMIRTIATEDATAFLLKEVREGPFASQMVAAEALLERNRPEAVAAMIAEWHDENPLLYGDSDEVRAGKRNHMRIAEFLINSGKPEAIRALSKNLRRRPIDLRVEVISQLRWAMMGDDNFTAAVEALLVDCLDDTEERRTWTYQSDSVNLSDPRVCDVAAGVLSDLLPEKYSFDLGALELHRDRRLLELKNVWRRAGNLPPLPVPELRSCAVVPEKTVAAHLRKFLANVKDERGQAQAEIEKLGVGAFWHVLDYRDGLSKKENYDLVDGLARKLASTVTEIEFARESLAPTAALRERFTALKNRPFDRKTFLQAIEATVKTLPPDVDGVEFCARRNGDNTGFILTIDLLSRSRATYRHVNNYREIVPGRGGVMIVLGPGGRPMVWWSPGDPDSAAQMNTEKNQMPKKLVFSSRVRVSSNLGNLGRNGLNMGGGQLLVHTASGEFNLSSSWSQPRLDESIDQALLLDPGESIDVSVRFTREWHPPGGGRYAGGR